MKICLPDINVWIALAFESHFHHAVTLRWFQCIVDSQLAFCRVTQRGFLRIASNAKAMGEDAMTLPDAWEAYDTIQRDPRIVFANEPAQLETHWRLFTSEKLASPKIWTDAYLAAFACEADYELVTLDSGFQRYEGLRLTHLVH